MSRVGSAAGWHFACLLPTHRPLPRGPKPARRVSCFLLAERRSGRIIGGLGVSGARAGRRAAARDYVPRAAGAHHGRALGQTRVELGRAMRGPTDSIPDAHQN